MPNLGFRLMAFAFRLRDLLYPRRKVLAEAGLAPGQRVLDFGCGPGSYVRPAAELVGAEGRAHALDRQEVALASVRRIAARHGLANVVTIHSDRATTLPDASIDVVLLYDVFHNLREPAAVLAELCRVLKPDGVLSFSDHHLREPGILAGVTAGGLFRLAHRGRKTFTFVKA